MKRRNVSLTLPILSLIMLFSLSAASLQAVTVDELAAAIGQGQVQRWRTTFGDALDALIMGRKIAPAALSITLRAFAGQKLSATPEEAARLVFAVCLQVDRELRSGTPSVQVALTARRMVRFQLRSGNALGSRASAQSQLKKQLSGMGAEVYGELENRPGPQSGPGARAQKGGTSSGTQGGTQRDMMSR